MFTDYSEALEWIHGRLKFGVKPGLKRMEWLLEKLDHPEKRMPVIHVAGTNGKGSTISYLLHMLTEAGYKIGSFTSPYIETFNERISVNGHPITDQEMLALVNEVKPLVENIEVTELGGPTEFEIITTMMYLYFGKYNKPDYLLLETGLGGRLDSTNIIEPVLSIITNVGYDHMNILGSTIAEIAYEKAGIIKNGVPTITAVENDQALHVIAEIAENREANLSVLGKDFTITNQKLHENGEVFSIQTPFKFYKDIQLTMRGEHQTKNAALSITAIDYLVMYKNLKIEEDQIRSGLRKALWKGRFEQVHENPEVIIDGAHNIEGVESLIETVKRHYPNKKVHFLVSVLKDKDYEEMIDRLSLIATSMHFTTFEFPRAAKAIDLYSVCNLDEKTYSEDWKLILANILNEYKEKKEDIVIILGSLYFISHIREFFKNR